MAQEFRDPRFRHDLDFVENHLTKECDPELGISGLPSPAKESVINIASFYNTMATMAAFDLVDRDAVVLMFGRRILRAWKALELFVRHERTGEPYEVGVLSFLEDLAVHSSTVTNDDVARRLGLRRFDK